MWKDGPLDRFRGELQPWRWGKLVTGKTIRKMLERGVLQGLLDGSRLTPEAVERVRNAAGDPGILGTTRAWQLDLLCPSERHEQVHDA